MSTNETPTLYDTLMALKPEDLSPNAWAVKADVNRNIFQNIRKSGRARNDILEKLLDAVGVSFAQFDAARSPVSTEVVGAGIVGDSEVRRAYRGDAPLPMLPLLGSAMGGEYGDMDEQIEMTELHMGEVLQYLVRPVALANDKDAYALTIVGDSMVPRFEPGDRVAVAPRSPLAIGDDVIVQLRGEEGDGERIKLVLIKRIVRRNASHIELRQYNPDRTFKVEMKRVAAMHKVLGRLF